MADVLSRPMAEIAVLLGEGKLKARALAEEAIANHERFGAKLMAYSQWAPEHARKCADAADAAFAVGSRAGSLQGIPTSIKDLFARSGFPTYAGSPKRLPPKFEMDGPVVASSAPAIGDGHGQDAYGRIRLRRHRPQRALRQPAQSLGREGASLARRLVERRRRVALRRLGAAGLRQRYRGLGAVAGVDDRQCRLEIHQGSLVDRRHRAAELHLRYARHPGAQHGGRGFQLRRARSASRRRLRFPAPRADRRRRHPHRHRRFLVLGRLRERHRRNRPVAIDAARPRRRRS